MRFLGPFICSGFLEIWSKPRPVGAIPARNNFSLPKHVGHCAAVILTGMTIPAKESPVPISRIQTLSLVYVCLLLGRERCLVCCILNLQQLVRHTLLPIPKEHGIHGKRWEPQLRDRSLSLLPTFICGKLFANNPSVIRLRVYSTGVSSRNRLIEN